MSPEPANALRMEQRQIGRAMGRDQTRKPLPPKGRKNSGSRANRFSTAAILRRRHQFYRRTLFVSIFVMVSLAFPVNWPLSLTAVGYLLLISMLSIELGGPVNGRHTRQVSDDVYRATGAFCLVALLVWLLTPIEQKFSGIPLLLALTCFSGWSLKRLVGCLSTESIVGDRVLAGALAGYLLLGISGGLLLSALETIQPGSFIATHDKMMLTPVPVDVHDQDKIVLGLDFLHINYFAFVSLTTVGYGDIIPIRPAAQMTSIALSVSGPLYIAVVMGVLISRFTSQLSREPAQGPFSSLEQRIRPRPEPTGEEEQEWGKEPS